MKVICTCTILVIILLSFCSCSKTRTTYTSSSTLKAEVGYIGLTGQVKGIDVYINDVKQTIDPKNSNPKIQIPNGTYNLRILRNSEVIVKQKVIVSTSNTTEVYVP
jgi:hypothetical protein